MVELGVTLATRNVVTGGSDPVARLREVIALAEFLEGAGFDAVWVGESLLARPRPEPMAVLAAMAARTRRISLGTAVVLAAMRHPLQLAQQAATVDLLAGGRLRLGVGSGFPSEQTRREVESLGIPFGERIARCHEVVAWCKAAWGAPSPDRAKYWQLSGIAVLPRPARPGGPPFWLGGATERTCETVGRRYDGWMPTSPSAESFVRGWRIVVRAATAAGRDPGAITPATMLTIAVDDDAGRAREQLASFINTYYGVSVDQARSVIGFSVGTVSDVVGDIRRFADAGVRHVLLRFATADQDMTIRRWAPLLRAALAEELGSSSPRGGRED